MQFKYYNTGVIRQNRSMKKYGMIGLFTGFVNGLLGGAAGLICVPLLKKVIGDEKQAHAYTLVTVFAASIFSCISYFYSGYIDIFQALPYIVGGALAAPLGVLLLKKIKPKILNKLFSVFMIYCAIRMLLGD